MPSAADITWLIPALPLAGFLLHAAVGKRLPRGVVGAIAVLAVLGAFAVSAVVLADLLRLPAEERRQVVSLFPGGADVPWIQVGVFEVYYRALLDPLALLMCLVVTGVGGLIHVYATGYMAHDKDYSRFFTYFNLFIFFMLTLVLSENLLLMFVGWEGVGLCSYLLIAFWYEDVENSKAGNKAFIVNRIGDVGFALGIMAVFSVFGTLSFYAANGRGFLDLAAAGQITVGAATLIGLLLFVGAVGKSAQFPLYVWLPDAMAGPTPVSALIHAATMVTAGVVMVTRVSPILTHSPTAMLVIALVGLFTAVLAASIALTQNDIKKVLAYSTVSQLGFMFLACGVGAFVAGMFHVTTHAFFKALLFLGAGSVIHALGGQQDMRKMGGLSRLLPTTYRTMALGTLAIAGIFPLAGFWSKDEILAAALHYPALGPLLYGVGLATALATAFYMSRLMMKTFLTRPRWTEAEVAAAHAAHGGGHGADAEGETHAAAAGDHAPERSAVHESPPSMTVPLVVLAVLSVVGGWIGIPGRNLFAHFMHSSTPTAAAHADALTGQVVILMAVGMAVGLAGVLLGYRLYARRAETGDLAPEEAKRRNPLYRGSLNLWHIDQTFYRIFVQGGATVAAFMARVVDRLAIDGTLTGIGWVTGFVSLVSTRTQTGFVRNYALVMLVGVAAVVIAMLVPGFRK